VSIAVLYEHPEWFQPLFDELERRQLPFIRLHAGELNWSAAEQPNFSLLVNRMSPSAYLRGNAHAIHATAAFLGYVESYGVSVVNDLQTYRIETSKSAQLDLFERVGAPYPATRAINHPEKALTAVQGLRFPIVVKPNLGGSGAGVTWFNTLEDLSQAVHTNQLDFGLDRTALVQEGITSPDKSITRVELIDGEPLYAIRITPPAGHGFNLCPADICQEPSNAASAIAPGQSLGNFCPTKPTMAIEHVNVHEGMRDVVTTIARAAGLDVCGVEYIVDERDGQPYVYDVNALSNFVTNAHEILGFDPFVRLVDLIELRWKTAIDSKQVLVASVSP
jgi:glutathione synthase/RimK-type ligase-like ATP-grasp enzyme